jgi:hypothetical protein
MKTQSLILFAVVAAASGCASSPPAPAGLTPGRFVSLECQAGKRLQARYAEDGRSVRVRAMHGAAELDRQGDGSFTGDGYVLRPAADGLRLDHKGKPEVQGCKA